MRLSKENIPNIRYLDGKRYKVYRIESRKYYGRKAAPLAPAAQAWVDEIAKAPVLTLVK